MIVLDSVEVHIVPLNKYMAIMEENTADRNRITSVIRGVVDKVNPSGNNATLQKRNKSIRILVNSVSLANFDVKIAVTKATSTGGGAGGGTFATNNDLVEAIYRGERIRTAILVELNRP